MADPFARACADRGIPLPPALAAFHDGTAQAWTGTATITRGRRWPVPLILRLAGFPPEGAGVETVLAPGPDGDGMIWERRFGAHRTVSRLRYRPDRRLVEERFGPFRLLLEPRPVPGGFALAVRGVSVLGIPVPRPLRPRPEVRETADGAALRFDIGATLPGLGLLIRYRGSVAPSSTEPSSNGRTQRSSTSR